MLTTISAGILLGLAGSLHCVGMCGPLALGLPVHQLSPAKKAAALGLYHSGRIATYSLLGLVFGLAGRRLYLAGMQQTVSIMLGCIILLYIIFKSSYQPAPVKKFQKWVQSSMIGLINKKSWSSFFLFGSLNGLLPCGMVYVAIAGAMSANDVLKGVLFMSGFGFATLPAMFALGFFGYLVNLKVRNELRRLSPYIICFIGVLLVLRGLNLGIPFVSPIMEPAPAAALECR
jgi:uncharacterized protein